MSPRSDRKSCRTCGLALDKKIRADEAMTMKEKDMKVKSDSSWVIHARRAWIAIGAWAFEFAVYVVAAVVELVQTQARTAYKMGNGSYGHMINMGSLRSVTFAICQVGPWFRRLPVHRCRKVSSSGDELGRGESPRGLYMVAEL